MNVNKITAIRRRLVGTRNMFMRINLLSTVHIMLFIHCHKREKFVLQENKVQHLCIIH